MASETAPRGTGAIDTSPEEPKYMGFVSVASKGTSTLLPVLEAALQNRGWVLGRTLHIVEAYSDGDYTPDVLQDNVRRLLDPNVAWLNKPRGRAVDVVVTGSTPATDAAASVMSGHSSPTPVVMAVGLPPSNIAAIDYLGGMMHHPEKERGTQVRLLAAVIRANRPRGATHPIKIGVIYHPRNRNKSTQAELAKRMGSIPRKQSLETTLYQVQTTEEIVEALESARRDGQDGLVFIDDALITINHKLIAEKVANEVKLPAIYGGVDGVAHGGLLAYGLQHERMFTAAGEMIDRVLRDGSGKSVKDLIGIHEPARDQLALAVNLTAAKGLNIRIPALSRYI